MMHAKFKGMIKRTTGLQDLRQEMKESIVKTVTATSASQLRNVTSYFQNSIIHQITPANMVPCYSGQFCPVLRLIDPNREVYRTCQWGL